jgi:hypothetical protein
MYKYIQDEIRNNSRLLLKDLSLPQQKAVAEVIRGLFTAGTPILRHLAQQKDVSVKNKEINIHIISEYKIKRKS